MPEQPQDDPPFVAKSELMPFARNADKDKFTILRKTADGAEGF